MTKTKRPHESTPDESCKRHKLGNGSQNAYEVKEISGSSTTPVDGLSQETQQLISLKFTLEHALKDQHTTKFLSSNPNVSRLVSDLDRALRQLPPAADSEPDYNDALKQLPAQSSGLAAIPAYHKLEIPASSQGKLPPLPELPESLVSEVFTHKSTVQHSRSSGKDDCTYEKLELLGDKYIELIAMRLINSRFGYLAAGRQSQLRELVVKNETLGEYLTHYRLEEKIKILNTVGMQSDKGNKGINKVHGDVFEAYVGALILGDEDNGFAVAEKWLTQLWAPKLLAQVKADRGLINMIYTGDETTETDEAKRTRYNPTAKAELQKLILGRDSKLEYKEDRPTVELKGAQLGQNRHFIALYLTGYGFEKRLVGKGEGGNKVEAGNWAATEAMYGEAKAVVAECAEKLRVIREEAKKAREEALAEGGGVQAKENGNDGKKDNAQEGGVPIKKEKKHKPKKEVASD